MLNQWVKNCYITYSVLGYPDIKSISKTSSVVDQLLSKKLEASSCCRRALYSLCQKMSHRNKWEHTYSALQTVWKTTCYLGAFKSIFWYLCYSKRFLLLWLMIPCLCIWYADICLYPSILGFSFIDVVI